MATKLRLQRHGRKKQAYYYIVAADARAPRDGRFIERIGDYNPNTNPATINLNLEHAVKWLDNGAIPTDTVKAILSYKGAMMMHHLHGGVRKGAMTAEQADVKFAEWMAAKDAKVQGKRDNLANKKAEANAAKFKAETAIKEAKAAAIAAKIAAEEAAIAAANTPVAEVVETPAVEAEVAETPVAEVEVTETPAAEAEVTEAPAAETEAPAENTEA
ncbi:MAG: 30S ribosomal protein S16 [Bacteroidota bacterium]